MRTLILILTLVAASAALLAAAEPAPPERVARLAKGVNVSHWLAQAYNVYVEGEKGGYRADHFERWITAADAERIAALGCTHVRLPFEPNWLFDLEAGAVKTAELPHLDRAIGLFTGLGLAVVVDAHPQRSLKGINTNEALEDAFVSAWRELSTHLAATTDPELVFIEPLNEPGGKGYYGDRWLTLQEELIGIVRVAAPEHTIIACYGGWMKAEELGQPLPYDNLVYAIHFYEPSAFTHQGAPWMKGWYHPLRAVPFPLDGDSVAAATAAVDTEGDGAEHADHGRRVLTDLAKKGIATEAHVRARLAAAGAWSAEHDQPVWIGEFGVMRTHAADADVERWLRVVREEAEAHGMGWCLWIYAAHGRQFNLVDEVDGTRVANPGMVTALGLDGG